MTRRMFSTNSRCIVLPSRRPDSYLGEEDMAEAKDVIKDDKLLELLHLAMDQGWEVKPTNNGKLMWYPKDKDMPPVPSPTRLVGRTLKNVRTALERSGLDTSSLKGDRPKNRRPLIAVSDDIERQKEAVEVGVENLTLTEDEEKHLAFQNALSDAVSTVLTEREDFVPTKTEQINTAIDLFLVSAARALIGFTEDTRDAFSCGHVSLDEIKAEKEKAEQLYLETCQELEQLRKHSQKQDERLSTLGGDYAQALRERDEALDRANKAESRLRALRTALTED